MSSIGKSVLKGLFGSLCVIFLICTLLGAVELFFDISDDILDIASVAILGIAAYTASYFSTQLHRSKGLIQGLICGAAIFLLALLLSIAFREFEFRDIMIVKAIVCVIFGIIGGIKGINTKKTAERH